MQWQANVVPLLVVDPGAIADLRWAMNDVVFVGVDDGRNDVGQHDCC